MRKKIFFFVFSLFLPPLLQAEILYNLVDFTDPSKRSRAILEEFSEMTRLRFAVPHFSFLSDTQQGGGINLKNRTEPVDMVFYYYSRNPQVNYVDFYLHSDTYFHPSDPLTIEQIQILGLAKWEDMVHLGPASFGLGLNFFGGQTSLYKKVALKNNSQVNFETEESELVHYLSDVSNYAGALTLYFSPYFYISFGKIWTVSQIEASSKENFSSTFIDSNFLGTFFLQGDLNGKSDEPQDWSGKVEIFNLIHLLTPYRRTLFPDIFLGYRYYNPSPKSADLFDESEKTLFMELFYNYYKGVYFKGKVEVLLNSLKGKMEHRIIKESLAEIGLNHDLFQIFTGKNGEEYYRDSLDLAFYYYLIVGVSRYADTRLTYFGSKETAVNGFSLGVKIYAIKWVNCEFRYQVNYSPNLRKMAEVYDHKNLFLTLQFFY